MNGNEKKTSDWKLILGGILLIVVLFLGVRLVFWGLEETIHRSHPDVYQSASAIQDASGESGSQEAPSFCVHCGKALPESFEWGQFCPYCGKKVE